MVASAKEQTPARSPRWVPLLSVGLAVLLGIAAVVVLTRDEAPSKGVAADGDTKQSDVVSPTVPSFRFTDTSRELVRTSPKPIGRRHRQASVSAAAAAQQVLTELYAEGFLDPANRDDGRYTDAFGGFTRGARDRAEARAALLTAGSRAGERFERIEPRSARIATRILLDREGAPVLLVSTVRFSALATGKDTVLLRSTGQYFFERTGGTWKIVSFQVVRNDAPREAA
jgi:hypothetical protein